MNTGVSPSEIKSNIKKSWLIKQMSQGVITDKPSSSTPLIPGLLLEISLSLWSICWLHQAIAILPFGKRWNKNPPFILTTYKFTIRTLPYMMGWANYGLLAKSATSADFVCPMLWTVLIFTFFNPKNNDILWYVKIIKKFKFQCLYLERTLVRWFLLYPQILLHWEA